MEGSGAVARPPLKIPAFVGLGDIDAVLLRVSLLLVLLMVFLLLLLRLVVSLRFLSLLERRPLLRFDEALGPLSDRALSTESLPPVSTAAFAFE